MAIVKILVYLAGGILVAPGALLAYFFWTVMGLTRQKNLLDGLFYILVNAVRLLEWGIWLVLAAVIIWLVLAFIPKYRFIGALGVAVVAVGSLIEFFVATGLPKSPGDLFVPFLSLTGLFLNLWLVSDAVAKPN